MRSGAGRLANYGADIVDESLFRCGDKPCRTDDELDDGHWSPRARLEIDAEVGGEGIKRKIAAGERLQHEDVRWRRLGFCWGRTEQQPGCHRRDRDLPQTLGICVRPCLPPSASKWRVSGLASRACDVTS